MQHILTVNETKAENNHLALIPLEEWPEKEWNTLGDGMRMLADSDALTFVYVLDSEEAFVQLRLPRKVWPELRKAYKEGWTVSVEGPTSIQLEHFHSEMEYLLDNIPGNNNYGSDMVEAVEHAFHIHS